MIQKLDKSGKSSIDNANVVILDKNGNVKKLGGSSPIISAALTKTDDTNVTLTLGGSPSTALLAATSLTVGWTGTLADSRITSAAIWNAKQDALGFTAENVANKQNSLTVDGTGTKYPTVDAVNAGITNSSYWTKTGDDIRNNNIGNVQLKLQSAKQVQILNSANTQVGFIDENGTYRAGTATQYVTVGLLGGNTWMSMVRSQASMGVILGNPQVSQAFVTSSTNYFGSSYIAGSNEVAAVANAEHSFNIGNAPGDGITSGIFRIGRTRLQSTVPVKYATDLSASYDARTLIDKGYADATYAPYYNTNISLSSGQSPYTLTSAEANARITTELTFNQVYSIVIPPNSSVPYLIGTEIRISTSGSAGFVTFSGGIGVTIIGGVDSPFRIRNGMSAILTKINTDVWNIDYVSIVALNSSNQIVSVTDSSFSGTFFGNIYGGFVGISNETNITFGQTTSFNKSGNGNSYSGTSGIQTGINTPISYLPTSGTGVFNLFTLNPTINQTGGANGITRGLYINPTLTAAADFRAIEVTAGKSIFQELNATSFIKSGGTSSQFLKADGSIDSNTYLTSASNYWTKVGNNIVKNNTGNVYFSGDGSGDAGGTGYIASLDSISISWNNGSFNTHSIGIQDGGNDGITMFINNSDTFRGWVQTGRNLTLNTTYSTGFIDFMINSVSKLKLNNNGTLKYATDVSSLYDDRTLVDKAYADTKQPTLSGTGFVVSTAGVITYDTNVYYLASNPSGYTNNIGTVTSVAALTIGTTGTDLSSTVATGTTTPVITLNVPTASASNRGVLSSADWTTFNNKQDVITLGNLTNSSSDGITITGGTNAINGTGVEIFQQVANTTQNGYLSSIDWTTFNGKQNPLSGTGFVKSTAGVISYDTSTYITGNQSITLSGAVTGTGTTAITTSLSNSVVGIANLTATGTPSATTYLRGDNTWATVAGGGGSPGGTVNEVQYNNGAGGFAGAANVEIETGNLKLVSTTDPATPTGGLIQYAKVIAGRVLPKIIGPSGIDTIMQVGLHGNSVFLVSPANATTAPNVTGGVITTATTISHQQTIASSAPWQATRRTRFQTSTTINNATGARTAYTQWFRGSAAGFGGFWFRCQLGQNINITGGQKFVGLCNSTGVLAGQPSALLNMCGMGFDSTDLATGNWQFMYNDGTGAATKVDLGANAVRNTTTGYDLIMYMAPGGSELFVRIVNIATNVVVLETSYTTLLPVANTGMAFKAEVRTTTAAADNIEIAKVYIETDY